MSQSLRAFGTLKAQNSRFYARKQLLFSARLSHRNSVCLSGRPSHGWINQKRCKLESPNITKSSPSAA